MVYEKEDLLKLLYRGDAVGVIKPGVDDPPWFFGEVTFEPDTTELQLFLLRFTDEDDAHEDISVSDERLNHENWCIVDATGRKIGIFLPAFYENNDIYWRLR
ncbi:hypothetical protein [Acanthopleuribacter pedis]|uniref:Uncharacterized protein n=1 Tax=Acanthopleuribacter pedis TaxID=442870 RepID=A0A8J7U6T5_9BACT|nr:hypothetical protein [Acanthopleuribacter pedis]MBO1321763.1 hypothetical protein [Acanthopleuribacter pedis]